MYRVSDFSKPTQHPYGMLDGKIDNANEKEVILMRMLIACINAGDWIAVTVDSRFSSHCLLLARYAYLTAEPNNAYRLTDKALQLLIKYYRS